MILPCVSTITISTCVPADWPCDEASWRNEDFGCDIVYFGTIRIACADQAAYAAAQRCMQRNHVSGRYRSERRNDEVLIWTNTRDHGARTIAGGGYLPLVEDTG